MSQATKMRETLARFLFDPAIADGRFGALALSRTDGSRLAFAGAGEGRPEQRVDVSFEGTSFGSLTAWEGQVDASPLATLLAPVLACPDQSWALDCLEAIAALRASHPAIDWIGVYRVLPEALVLAAQLPFAADHRVIPPDEGICWQVVRGGKTIDVPDTTERPDFVPCEFPSRSSLVVPIVRPDGSVMGEIEADARAPHAFTAEVVRAVEAAAAGLGKGEESTQGQSSPSDPIRFYAVRDDKFGCFSNFSPHEFTAQGRVWRTSEAYFQAQKFTGAEGAQAYDEIHKTKSPFTAAEVGRKRSNPLRADWEAVKDEIMYEALKAKFTQNPDILAILLGTGERPIIEDAPNDYYWGCGRTGTGKNMLGQLLVRLRSELR